MTNNHLVFCVIGAGNVGKAMSAYLAARGYRVHLYNRGKERIANISNGILLAQGSLRRSIRLEMVTTDLRKAVEGSDIIIVTITSLGHEELMKNLVPYLVPSQIVVLHPGRVGGALLFKKILSKNNVSNITVIELETSIFAARAENTHVRIMGIKRRVHGACLPALQTDRVVSILTGALPQIVSSPNVLYTGLMNYGMILHPAPLLFNAARVDLSHVRFRHYIDGITPSIADFLERMDKERIAVGKALDIKLMSTSQWLSEVYGSNGTNLYEILQNTSPYHSIYAPNTLRHRYIMEDVPNALVPISELASVLKIDTPLINLVIDMCSSLLKCDFRKTGRTLNKLGIANMTKKEIFQYINS